MKALEAMQNVSPGKDAHIRRLRFKGTADRRRHGCCMLLYDVCDRSCSLIAVGGTPNLPHLVKASSNEAGESRQGGAANQHKNWLLTSKRKPRVRRGGNLNLCSHSQC